MGRGSVLVVPIKTVPRDTNVVLYNVVFNFYLNSLKAKKLTPKKRSLRSDVFYVLLLLFIIEFI